MDQKSIASRLEGILQRFLPDGGSKKSRSPAGLDANVSFAELGVNSVDLVEFVLEIEKGFGIRILDQILPEELPSTLGGWTELVQKRSGKVVT